MRRYLYRAGALALIVNAASAAPPSSCASKFIGTWTYSGGSTTVNPDGTANPRCMACVAVQTWTCSGNTYLFSNSGPPGEFSAVLIDANHMQGSGVIATRVGGAKAATAAPKAKVVSSAGELIMKQARAAEQYCTYADQMQAAGKYLEAADVFQSEGLAERAAQAKKLATRASANADRCEKKKVARPAPPSPRKAQEPDDKCKEARRYLLRLRLEGYDTSEARDVLRKLNCG